ncbi:hypothetical protein AAFF_G00076240 [Aldrovandia affinis]|uniref:Endonuclease/exonuclease/phosphatase domain-containing protein n=1 Tax=Aldrovandia affinis TaxID=143900 RepID=A0AAD7R262_9TELE|nr:hypothetical protein AAFF_G00076240 [Aldrovandia affinis]
MLVKYRVINVYAPAQGGRRLEVIRELPGCLSTSRSLILGGDFNICLDVGRGGSGGRGGVDYSARALGVVGDFGLTDAFRTVHPGDAGYTWRNSRGFASRLDYIFVGGDMWYEGGSGAVGGEGEGPGLPGPAEGVGGGEKPSAYFFQAARARRAHLPLRVSRPDGTVAEGSAMLAVAEAYYAELFSRRACDPVAEAALLDCVSARLEARAQSMEAGVSLEEVRALLSLRDEAVARARWVT